MKGKLNITIEESLWNDLRRIAAEQTLLEGRRVAVVHVLRVALKVFTRLTIKEVNAALDREPRNLYHQTKSVSPAIPVSEQRQEPESPEISLEQARPSIEAVELNSDGESDPIRERQRAVNATLSAGKNV